MNGSGWKKAPAEAVGARLPPQRRLRARQRTVLRRCGGGRAHAREETERRGARHPGRGRGARSMASNIYLVRQRISRLGQVRPREAPPLPSPCPPLASRHRPSSVPASEPRRAAQLPLPRPAPPRGLPGPPPRARPAWPSSLPCCSVSSSPLLLLPAVLTLSPSFPQRMSSFQLNINPLKEPLGFIKVLEWVSAARASEAWNRAAVTVTAPAPAPAGPAPSAGRPRAPGARAGAAGPPRAPRPPPPPPGGSGTGGRGLGLRGAGTPRSASNHESLGRLGLGRGRAPTPNSPLGAPVGVGVQISLWLHSFPQGKRKLPVAV